MQRTPQVDAILARHNHLPLAVRANLARVLYSGALGGSGQAIFYPVDQQIEHGPDRTFNPNPLAHDPFYLADLTLETGMSAMAVPFGTAARIADRYAGLIPLIVKLNSRSSLSPEGPFKQARFSTAKQAAEIGAVGVGYTIYPGSSMGDAMFEQLQEEIQEANSLGLVSVVWCYMRGECPEAWGKKLKKEGDEKPIDVTSAIDVTNMGVRLGLEAGATIVKAKFPKNLIGDPHAATKKYFEGIDLSDQTKLAECVQQAAMGGHGLVLYSGGDMTGNDKDGRDQGAKAFYEMAVGIRDGGCLGSICGRNVTQRSHDEAVAFVQGLVDVYLGSDPESAMRHLLELPA